MIQSYDLAYHMQHALPQVMRLNEETASTKLMYGITDENPQLFSVQCLMARRLAEAGVRFIQLTARGWDNHTDLPVSLPQRCRDIDQPIAALITDLRQRGMLDDTLIVWGGEFGRSAGEQNNGDGRRHQNLGYTMFLAGGGVRGGRCGGGGGGVRGGGGGHGSGGGGVRGGGCALALQELQAVLTELGGCFA